MVLFSKSQKVNLKSFNREEISMSTLIFPIQKVWIVGICGVFLQKIIDK